MLCLTGQINTDFEILIIGHNVEPEKQAGIERIINQLPAWQKDKVSYHCVNGGTRTKPLNEAFSIARGYYIAILDDDDIVFDNWVSNFSSLAQDNYGKILFSFPLEQDWERQETQDGRYQLQAVGSPKDCYCREFDPVEQLVANFCPPVSLAFPSFIFQQLGIHFDESLTTTEDWDFLMRAYFVCGIETHKEPSSIYRIWKNAENSRTAHSAEEWERNYAKIIDRFNSFPFLIDKGNIERLQSRSGKTLFSASTLAHQASLQLSSSKTFREKTSEDLQRAKISNDPNWTIQFHNLEHLGKIQCIKFSPSPNGYITLSDFIMEITGMNNEHFTLDLALSHSNGQQVDCGHVVFFKEHPYLVFDLPTKTIIKNVSIKLTVRSGAADNHIDQAVRGSLGLMTGRGNRWIRRQVKNIVNKFTANPEKHLNQKEQK